MNDNTGFDAYALYNALRLHFAGTYDYVKYNGKTSVSRSTFANRKDKFQFYKLSRKYGLDDLKYFYIANFLEKDIDWVGDLLNAEGEDRYKKWQKRNQSLTYTFEQDIIHLFESSGNCLYSDNGNYPYLLTELMQNEVCIETVCIMDDIMNFLPMWERKITDDIIWPKWQLKIMKYKPFVKYDKQKFVTLLKEKYKEYAEA